MNANNKVRELSEKELKQVAGGAGWIYGKPKGGDGFYFQFFMGSKPGKG